MEISKENRQASKGTQAIGRAAALLRALARDNQKGQGLAEVAGHLLLERPTAYRILRRLVEEGLVRQDPATRNYHLGPLVYELGLVSDTGNTLRDLCRPSLDRLAAQSGDTVFLIALRGVDSVCLDRVEGNYPVKALLLESGQRRPTGIGAGSLALLAHMGGEQVATLLGANTRLLLDAGESIESLKECVSAARVGGYAIKRPPAMPDILSVAVAVVDQTGAPLVALSISGLSHRISSRLDMLTKALMDEAKAVYRSTVNAKRD